MSDRIGVAADLHFGRGGSKGVSQYEKSFREMIAGMIERDLSIAVFAGDIYHQFGWFTPDTFEILSSGFRELQDHNIRVEIIAGNHDYDRSGTVSAVEPFRRIGLNVHTEIEHDLIGDYFFTFIPWITKAKLKARAVNVDQDAQDMVYNIHEQIVKPALKEQLPTMSACEKTGKITICVFHASLIGFSPCSTSANIVGTDFLLDPDLLREYGYDHVIGGHFHRRQGKENCIWYVGSMERNDFGEKGNPTGWLEIEGKMGQFHEIESSQRFYEFEFEGELAKNLGDDFSGAMVKLKPHVSRLELLDRAALEKPFFEAGASKVIIEPVYTDTEMARSAEIKADQSLAEQFRCWEKANPEKAQGGALGKLLTFENKNSFPDEVEPDYFDEAMKCLGG